MVTDRSEINGNNLNNIRRESSRHKKREHLKEKINKLHRTVRARKLETCIEEFKKGLPT
jgi:hypothetical protein